MNKIFKDKEGHVVIIQSPNLPLLGWLILEITTLMMSKGRAKEALQNIAKAFLFIWAYLEVTKGVNLFRKLFGLSVMMIIILSYFVR